MSKKTGKKVSVVGAGIVGVSTAIELLCKGYEVTLIDREGPASGTSYGNGGVLASCAMVPVTVPGILGSAVRMLASDSSPLFVQWRSVPGMMPWLIKYLCNANHDKAKLISAAIAPLVKDSLEKHQSLAKGTKAERWIKPSDYLYLYDNRKSYQSDSFAWEVRAAHGFSWDEVQDEQVKELEPEISGKYRFAVRLKNHGHITDPGNYVKDLAKAFEDQGGKILISEVSGVADENGAISALISEKKELPCDIAVIAAGIWPETLAQKFGINVPIESERGYHLELWEPSIYPKAPLMIASGKAVATPMDGRLRIAGLVELAGVNAPASEKPVRLLEQIARDTFPGIEWKKSTSWLGHRPAPSDSIPVIGQVPGVTGAYLAFGHHHIGLTAGPATGQLLTDMIVKGKDAGLESPYSPARFVKA